MRNRRLAAVIAGALLAGSLTAGAGVAIATADRDEAPGPAPVAPAPHARTDAARTLDVLSSLGTVTHRVNDLVVAAKRGSGTTEAQQSASALGNAAEELAAKVGKSAGQGVPDRHQRTTRDRVAIPTVEQAIAALRTDVQALLAALRANDPAAAAKAVEAVARDTVALVKAILAALDAPALPVGIPAS
ncbi:hypothetical protein [Peterkaempfera bronchialis]|uniref:hypothetical protein n=1 Tax=Peterkaempfera bronchialis TaxID=2126346 RepID=UPI003C2F5FA7